ncbi:MAG: hypothetical protein LBT22_01230 [Peptococcaceae bacterium]|nr:hypothetical protein [Peptococcaceae bacterium]
MRTVPAGWFNRKAKYLNEMGVERMVTEYVLKKTPYRWLMLLLLLLSNFSVNYAQFQFTVFSGPFMTATISRWFWR